MLKNDVWIAVSELAASQHGRFTINQAAESGITRRALNVQVQLGTLVRDQPRVLRVRGAPMSWKGALSAAVLSAGGVASHRAAARLHRLDGFDRAPLELSIARGRLPETTGVVRHRWTDPEPELDHTSVDGIACTTIEATLCQLGSVVSEAKLEQALDDALRVGIKPESIDATLARLHRRGPSGTGKLRRLICDERRTGSLPDSWFERLVQRLLDDAQVPAPELQFELKLRSGRAVRLDMAWPNVRLGLECHSRRYHFGDRKEAADHVRDLELASDGWEILYLTWHQLQKPGDFVRHLARTIATRREQLNISRPTG